MLERTIGELRGEDVADEISISINLGIDLAIPKDYIIETGQRLRTYKRVSAADSETDIENIRQELEDRYGSLPVSVDNLLQYSLLRRSAESMRLLSIEKAGGGLAIKFGPESKVDPDRLMEMVATNEGVTFSPNGVLRVASIGAEGPIAAAHELLERVRG